MYKLKAKTILYLKAVFLVTISVLGLLLEEMKKHFELHKIIKLRKRYILTRDNRVRLRYMAMTGCVLVASAFSFLTGPASSIAMKWEGAPERPVTTNEIVLAEMTIQKASEKPDMSSLEEEHHEFDQSSELSRDITQQIDETLRSQVSDGIRKVALAIQKPDEKPLNHELSINSGDTVAGVLQSVGVSAGDSYEAIKAMSEHFDPRKVKPGQKIKVDFVASEEKPDQNDFASMVVKIDPVKEVLVTKGEEGFKAELVEKELKERVYAGNTKIQTSLYGSAARAGIPSHIIADMIRVYSWDVDFQRDIRQGDLIEVLYSVYETEDGEFAKYGDVLYANLSMSGRDIPIYRFEMEEGRVDYFDPKGHSIRKTLMKTPIDGARISSGFGMRKHPILGYNKMHKGVDFAAPTGTPIYAAGDGKIEHAGRNGAYGNYVRIRHNNTLKTAYAHLHKFGKGMKKGKYVRQGDIIGYVGTTGRSTGPHLHYEVLLNGKQVSPNRVDLPTGEQLKGKQLEDFKAVMASLSQQYVSLVDGLKVAMGGP